MKQGRLSFSSIREPEILVRQTLINRLNPRYEMKPDRASGGWDESFLDTGVNGRQVPADDHEGGTGGNHRDRGDHGVFEGRDPLAIIHQGDNASDDIVEHDFFSV
jgi:hypothetical protein